MQIRAAALDADGNVLVGGDFSRIGGRECQGIARLTSTGAHDIGFLPKLLDGVVDFSSTPHLLDLPPVVTCLAQTPDGDWLLGGQFWLADFVPRLGMVRVRGGASEFKFHSVTCLGNGRNLIRFSEPRGQEWSIQGSANLRDWVDLSPGRPTRDTVEYTDETIPPSSTRFYRAVRIP